LLLLLILEWPIIKLYSIQVAIDTLVIFLLFLCLNYLISLDKSMIHPRFKYFNFVSLNLLWVPYCTAVLYSCRMSFKQFSSVQWHFSNCSVIEILKSNHSIVFDELQTFEGLSTRSTLRVCNEQTTMPNMSQIMPSQKLFIVPTYPYCGILVCGHVDVI